MAVISDITGCLAIGSFAESNLLRKSLKASIFIAVNSLNIHGIFTEYSRNIRAPRALAHPANHLEPIMLGNAFNLFKSFAC